MKEEDARKWRRRRRRLRRRVRRGAGFLVVAGLLALIVVSVLHHSPKQAASAPTTTVAILPASHDVKMTGCSYDNYAATATFAVTNHGIDANNYVITVYFYNGKVAFNGATATTDGLLPQRRTTVRAIGARISAAPTHLRCVVASIKRFS